ncbi:MAG: hypothetical protein IKY33_03365 [Clostridia bacterium]|nr:hypothetical protein [Clostridia bacterium]
MNKKNLSILCIFIVLLLSLCACTDGGEQPQGTPNGTTSATDSSSEGKAESDSDTTHNSNSAANPDETVGAEDNDKTVSKDNTAPDAQIELPSSITNQLPDNQPYETPEDDLTDDYEESLPPAEDTPEFDETEDYDPNAPLILPEDVL